MRVRPYERTGSFSTASTNSNVNGWMVQPSPHLRTVFNRHDDMVVQWLAWSSSLGSHDIRHHLIMTISMNIRYEALRNNVCAVNSAQLYTNLVKCSELQASSLRMAAMNGT
jgi:hypothetical protein